MGLKGFVAFVDPLCQPTLVHTAAQLRKKFGRCLVRQLVAGPNPTEAEARQLSFAAACAIFAVGCS